jgi:hypothetical protein
MTTCHRRVILILLTIALYSVNSLAALEQSHRVTVSIIRQESSIHTSIGNRDAYLIKVTSKTGRVYDGEMIDEYPSYAEGLPTSSLSDGETLSVALRRTRYCDTETKETNLASPVRCFEVVHGSWKLPKAQRDEWWK